MKCTTEHANRTQNVSGSNDKCVFSTHMKSTTNDKRRKEKKKNTRNKKSAKIEYQKSHAHTTFSPYAKHNVGLLSIFGLVSISKYFSLLVRPFPFAICITNIKYMFSSQFWISKSYTHIFSCLFLHYEYFNLITASNEYKLLGACNGIHIPNIILCASRHEVNKFFKIRFSFPIFSLFIIPWMVFVCFPFLYSWDLSAHIKSYNTNTFTKTQHTTLLAGKLSK